MRKTLSLFIILFVFLPGVVSAAMYSYVDARGVVHYTNVSADARARIKNGKEIKMKKMSTGRFSSGQKLFSAKYRRAQRPVSEKAVHAHINRAASKHKVDPLLIRAIIKTESDFNPYAVSTKGAQGLMQLMPGTAKDLRVADPFNAQQNIEGGTRYFSKLLHSYHGNIELSLAAYNAGPGRVKPYGTIPKIPETVKYVSKVMKYYDAYRKAFNDFEGFGRVSIQQLAVR